MPILPLHRKLRKKMHRIVAFAQDLMVLTLYEMFPTAIIHGGTCIWRCYGSNRFSEDLDIYLPTGAKGTKSMDRYIEELKRRDFQLGKFKVSTDTLFAKFTYRDVVVRLEAVFKETKRVVSREYEMIDGSFIAVYTPPPEELVREKVEAYRSRRKVRDLYDIYFLLNFIERKEDVIKDLTNLLEDFKYPVDSEELKTLIISGAVPRVEDMFKKVEIWVRRNI
ncbi:hypothetical protein B6U74_03870 [Candidatus Bathyarchaeota archaeon ex4484_205]|nr:MAG: hypothetical protein B6U74_03870 [Candidatus Bathyarchaeota archaeon ex4484_205]